MPGRRGSMSFVFEIGEGVTGSGWGGGRSWDLHSG